MIAHNFSCPRVVEGLLRPVSTILGMSKRVLVPIADDSEEIETTCITGKSFHCAYIFPSITLLLSHLYRHLFPLSPDTLVRFGAEVVVASVKPGGELVCKMSRGIKVVADIPIEEAVGMDWDLVVLPGGMPGAEHLRDSAPLISILEKQKAAGKLYGAICASPAVVLASKGLVGNGATCFPAPGLRAKMASPVDDDVVVQGNVVTSKGPATALRFAVQLGEQLFGAEKAKEIAKQLLL